MISMFCIKLQAIEAFNNEKGIYKISLNFNFAS